MIKDLFNKTNLVINFFQKIASEEKPVSKPEIKKRELSPKVQYQVENPEVALKKEEKFDPAVNVTMTDASDELFDDSDNLMVSLY